MGDERTGATIAPLHRMSDAAVPPPIVNKHARVVNA